MVTQTTHCLSRSGKDGDWELWGQIQENTLSKKAQGLSLLTHGVFQLTFNNFLSSPYYFTLLGAGFSQTDFYDIKLTPGELELLCDSRK